MDTLSECRIDGRQTNLPVVDALTVEPRKIAVYGFVSHSSSVFFLPDYEWRISASISSCLFGGLGNLNNNEIHVNSTLTLRLADLQSRRYTEKND